MAMNTARRENRLNVAVKVNRLARPLACRQTRPRRLKERSVKDKRRAGSQDEQFAGCFHLPFSIPDQSVIAARLGKRVRSSAFRRRRTLVIQLTFSERRRLKAELRTRFH